MFGCLFFWVFSRIQRFEFAKKKKCFKPEVWIFFEVGLNLNLRTKIQDFASLNKSADKGSQTFTFVRNAHLWYIIILYVKKKLIFFIVVQIFSILYLENKIEKIGFVFFLYSPIVLYIGHSKFCFNIFNS